MLIRSVVFGLALIGVVVSLWAPYPADARRHHRARPASEQKATEPAGKPIVQQKRDPADIALDRRIKAICRGC